MIKSLLIITLALTLTNCRVKEPETEFVYVTLMSGEVRLARILQDYDGAYLVSYCIDDRWEPVMVSQTVKTSTTCLEGK